MAFEERSSERIDCENCGAEHTVAWFRMPAKEPYELVCRRCGTMMSKGKSVRAYENLRLI